MYQQEDITTQPDGTRPADDSVETLSEHLIAILHHPLTPRLLYLEVKGGLRIISRGTDALARPDCVRHIIPAAVERERRHGRGQREDSGDDGCGCECD